MLDINLKGFLDTGIICTDHQIKAQVCDKVKKLLVDSSSEVLFWCERNATTGKLHCLRL